MTTDEHLDRIASKCRSDIAGYVRCESILSDAQRRALAAMRSTVAAIDEMRQWHNPVVDSAIDAIIAAWPEDSL